MASDLAQQLIDSGIHFGHKASRWNPKMKPYILSKHNTVHLINIRETIKGLLRAEKFITRVVANNQDVLFVATKRQGKPAVEAHAKRVGMPYVSERWLGGILTNFRTIRSRLARLEELEQLEESGQLYKESKKTIARWTRERKKILRNLSGIRNMSALPGAVVLIDAKHERNAILEARKLGIPTVCLIDTDSDPDLIDIPIPGNDDAIRAIEVIVSRLADAAQAGKLARPVEGEKVAANAPKAQKRSRRPTTSQLAAESEATKVGSAESGGSSGPTISTAPDQATAVALAEPKSTSAPAGSDQA